MNGLYKSTVLFILAAGLSACAPAAATPTPAPTPVTVQLKFLHDAQFGGFYAADQKGYYTAEGLAVTLVPGTTDTDVLRSVLDNQAQFGVTSASELILGRAEGKPVRAIATTYRRNPTVFFALASTGITRPQDFVGKKIRAVSDQPLVLHAMTARLGIRPDQYSEVNLPSDVALFASDEVPVWGAY
ncbi:MAG: ABC transporter substrate-binding protein, partial [Chloroflexota bacterium]|nr:ABC transporter substrate-binding protein [Chloroflexota bacterium]